MIVTTTSHFTFSGSTAISAPIVAQRRRRVSPEAGHALEKLGHAIEYLSDEFVHEDGSLAGRQDDRLEAIELLMSLNRQVYFECPEIPSLRERFKALLQRVA
ncbi:MAG TPA: hypothetical protein VG225_04320 [Terracidiphilus sp.]|jgi:hypothetical protein|nr:hypothetical protein [Terracidiphilus sp.]